MPQLEDGYIRIATELWEALTKIRIPGEAIQVLNAIVRKTYGWQKKWDTISLSQFEEMTGISRSHIVRARKKLLDMNLIIAKKGNDGNISYCIQKDYHKWRPLPKKETLPKKEIDVAKKGNRGVPKKGHTKDTITKDTNTKDKRLADESAKGKGEKTTTPDIGEKQKVATGRITQVFNKCYKKLFETEPPDWTVKELSKAKNLIKRTGEDRACELVKYVFDKWKVLRMQWSITGAPSMGIIMTFGIQLLPKLKKKEPAKEDKRRGKDSAEDYLEGLV